MRRLLLSLSILAACMPISETNFDPGETTGGPCNQVELDYNACAEALADCPSGDSCAEGAAYIECRTAVQPGRIACAEAYVADLDAAGCGTDPEWLDRFVGLIECEAPYWEAALACMLACPDPSAAHSGCLSLAHDSFDECG